jgi:hypothetical protein
MFMQINACLQKLLYEREREKMVFNRFKKP